ncbi:MAG TPA: ester cyclase [Ktedonobacteraceae bacterium]|nr:ester cyclase [Ktedonobacteraceae bacterium]
MSTEDNKAIDRRVTEEGWNQGNTALFDEFFTADFIGHDPFGPVHGPEGFKQFYATYRTAFPDTHVTIEDQIAEGETVASRWTGTGTHQGPLMGIPPSGKRVRVTGITISRYASGKIVEAWFNYDTLGMLQQIGALPAPGQ